MPRLGSRVRVSFSAPFPISNRVYESPLTSLKACITNSLSFFYLPLGYTKICYKLGVTGTKNGTKKSVGGTFVFISVFSMYILIIVTSFVLLERRIIMALTDTQIRSFKPKNTAYYVADRDALHLAVHPSGKLSWVVRFQFNNKRRKGTIGPYPEISLKEARDLAPEKVIEIKYGLPKLKKDANGEDIPTPNTTFQIYAERWLNLKMKKLGHGDAEKSKTQSTYIQITRSFKNDMFPLIGKRSMCKVTKFDCLEIQRKIEARGAFSISEKYRSWIKEIFDYAIAEGVVEDNPARDLHILALPYRRTCHNPYLTEKELPKFFESFNNFKGSYQTLLGLKMLFFTGVRTGELRQANFSQFDLDKGLWIIPAENVKQLKSLVRNKGDDIPPYVVPLPTQAIEVVKELVELGYKNQPYLLSHRTNADQMISENTLNYALHRMGYQDKLTAHGIRATISTALNESEYPKDWIEAQLSHSDKDKIRQTYNHAKYIEPRRKMMQEWADKLVALGMK